MEKNRLVVVIVILSLFVLALGGFIVYDKVLNKNNDNEVLENEIVKLLTNEQAIEEGKKLYDMATKVYEAKDYHNLPFCGVLLYSDDIKDKTLEELDVGQNEKHKYYKSDFSNKSDLEKYLKQWLSDDIVNDIVETNNSIDYMIVDNILYCRLEPALGGHLSYYQKKYDIKVNSIEENKITYTVSSAYSKDKSCIMASVGASVCDGVELEYRDTNFVIEKNESGNFVVTEFTLHD